LLIQCSFIGSILLTSSGTLLLLKVENPSVRYFACFLFAVVYATKIDIMWLADNVSGHYKRATMIGVTIAIANSSGILLGQVFTEQSAPRYIMGLNVSLGTYAIQTRPLC
jgi:hypothetical protein